MSDSAPARRRRVLLDENLPRELVRELPDHNASTVGAEGWKGVLNGELLRRAEAAGFDVFVTADRNLEYQQTLTRRSFGVVVIIAKRLKFENLLPLCPALREAVAAVEPGQVLHVRPLA